MMKCSVDACYELARHKVDQGGVDTGLRLCCAHMDWLMQEARTVVEDPTEAAEGYAAFVADHQKSCDYVTQ